MPVYKRKYKSGSVVWSRVFSGPGATREHQNQITETGFASKKQAQGAEAARRIEEQQKYELAKAGVATVASEPPKTLAGLMQLFLQEHAKNLAPKTIERYRESVAYRSPELTGMALCEITPLHPGFGSPNRCGPRTADIYAHAIHGQDDEAAQEWVEYQQKNRNAEGASPVRLKQ